eukprot:gene17417-22967_t
MFLATSTVFVGNLAWTTTEDMLINLFNKVGNVLRVEIKRYPDTGRSKGWGLIVYEKQEHAKAAVEQLNSLELDSRSIHVRYDRSVDSVNSETLIRVFVGNLSWEISDSVLYDHFKVFNPVDVEVMTNMIGRSRGFAIVQFDSKDNADNSIKALNQSLLFNRKIQCRLDRGPGRILRPGTKLSTIFVKNIDPSYEDNDLFHYYSNIGVVKSAKVKHSTDGTNSHWGIVQFVDPNDAEKAITETNGLEMVDVRDKRGYDILKKLGASTDQIKIGDIRKKESLKDLFDGASKCIMCTSARPLKKLSFRIKNLFRIITFRSTLPPSPTDLYYPKEQSPYYVDYIGQRNTIDALMKIGIEHIVLLGNMGGYRGSKLNEIGRKTPNDDPKIGNLLKWKRAAERYLMKRCFFTIVHSAALTNEKGGQREIIWDVDDSLLRTNYRKIPRDDVAEVLIQALLWKEAIGRSIDVSSRPVGQGIPTKDWFRFWAMPGNCLYPADFDDLDN